MASIHWKPVHHPDFGWFVLDLRYDALTGPYATRQEAAEWIAGIIEEGDDEQR
jgi:hypothetical protein